MHAPMQFHMQLRPSRGRQDQAAHARRGYVMQDFVGSSVGTASIRWRKSAHSNPNGACVERHGAWTRVIARRRGFVRLSTRFALERVVSRGRRCDP